MEKRFASRSIGKTEKEDLYYVEMNTSTQQCQPPPVYQRIQINQGSNDADYEEISVCERTCIAEYELEQMANMNFQQLPQEHLVLSLTTELVRSTKKCFNTCSVTNNGEKCFNFLFQVVIDFTKDVGMSTCKQPLLLFLFVYFLDIHPYSIHQFIQLIFILVPRERHTK